jgi:hypothetical protein
VTRMPGGVRGGRCEASPYSISAGSTRKPWMAGTSAAMTVRERLWVTPKGRWYYRAVKGKWADRRQIPLIRLFPAQGFMHNPNEVCIAPIRQLRDAPVEKALIRQ